MYATVVVNRDRKRKIVYNSGKIYFREKTSIDLFLEEAKARGLEAYEIKLKSPLYEPGQERGDGYFCPYCGNWEFWVSMEDAKHCPVCGISNHDYYVKKVNNLWHKNMASKKDQHQKAKARRRREKNAK